MFDPDALYLVDDPALLKIGPPGTLANWRCQGKGPAYLRLGKRVCYRGRDLLDWLESKVVHPTAA